MTRPPSATLVAFDGFRRIASGPAVSVALAVRAATTERVDASILVFDESGGAQIDLDLRGDDTAIHARYGGQEPDAPTDEPAPAPAQHGASRGRPKIGVVAREVTLLPRHWDWLAGQPGGASAALRRLVDAARQTDSSQGETRRRREAAYRIMAALGGDLPGFEEASRALFAGDGERFRLLVGGWPGDLPGHLVDMAFPPSGRS